jgi:hypothetical protein
MNFPQVFLLTTHHKNFLASLPSQGRCPKGGGVPQVYTLSYTYNKTPMTRIYLFLLFLLTTTFHLSAQKTDKPLPIDPNIKIGKLSNGLTYYIRKNQEPKNRAELRLVVNAGSVLETDKQVGLAHFVEHMAFNGTQHFKKNELVNFLREKRCEFWRGPECIHFF